MENHTADNQFDITPTDALKRGLSIIPERNKIPIGDWKEFQTRQPTFQELKAWEVERVTGYAIVTGHFNKVVVLDFDGEEGRTLLERWKLSPHVQTPSGGFHVYVEHPGFRFPTTTGATTHNTETPAMPRFYNRQEVLNLPNGTLVSYLNREEDRYTYRIYNNKLEFRLDSYNPNSWLISAAFVDDWYIVGPPRRKPFGDFHDR